MVAFLSLLLSLLVWLPAGDLQSGDDQGVGASGGVLAPQSHSAASAEFVCRGRLSNVFKLLTVVMLAMFALSEHKEMERADRQDLMALERSLLEPAVRASAAQLDALLADGFREVGASGRAFGKGDVLARLPEESGVVFTTAGMDVQLLGKDYALVTYRAIRSADGEDLSSLRSSLWRREASGWRMLYHQGTPLPPGGTIRPCPRTALP